MDLRLKLDDRDFDALATTGRSMIPSLAPEWTDHNIHDPGIMLVELMAWVAEAQIYSLGRIRNDEKAAFARLLGIADAGPRPARGLIWPLEPGESGYLEGAIGNRSVEKWTPVTADRSGIPQFRLTADQYLTSARLTGVRTLFSDGRAADHTGLNRKNGATFLPFGPAPTTRDRLELSFTGTPVVPGGKGAFVIGVEVLGDEVNSLPGDCTGPGVDVSLVSDGFARPIRVERDTTMAFAQSGVISLSIPDEGPPQQDADLERTFQLILSPRTAGFIRPPRLRRLAVNVLDVEQAETIIEEEAYFGKGLPDQTYTLLRPGRILDAGLTVEIDGQAWSSMEELETAAPEQQVFALDNAAGRIVFGNGINGKVPPQHSSLKIVYDVSAGAIGNAPAGVGWSLRGLAGIFGRNSQSFAHGSDPLQTADIQAEARSSLSQRTTYVTPEDVQQAALSMTDLGVVRAFELPPRPQDHAGIRGLLVAGTPDPASPIDTAPENPRWLGAIRSRLAPHMPAGQYLYVIGPQYVRLRIGATLTVADRGDPDDIVSDALELLKSKFHDPSGIPIWAFGRDVTPLQIMGWLRKLDLVLGVGGVILYRDGEVQTGPVSLSARELPRFEATEGDIVVTRRGSGRPGR